MRVGIVGSRDWPEPDRVLDFVSKLARKHPRAVVVSGHARGVDTLAEGKALECGLDVVTYRIVPTNGIERRYRFADGRPPRIAFVDHTLKVITSPNLRARNSYIVSDIDRLVAFNAKTPGTTDTVEKTKAEGKPVAEFFPYVEKPDIYDAELLIALLKTTLDAVEIVEEWELSEQDRFRKRPFDLKAHLRRQREKAAQDAALAEIRAQEEAALRIPTPEDPRLFDIPALSRSRDI